MKVPLARSEPRASLGAMSADAVPAEAGVGTSDSITAHVCMLSEHIGARPAGARKRRRPSTLSGRSGPWAPHRNATPSRWSFHGISNARW